MEELENNSHNEFYHEIAELAFRLMGDTTDVDSSIQLLLHKIRDYFGFSIVTVQQVVPDETRMLQYIYESIGEGIESRRHKVFHYTEADWLLLTRKLEHGRYFQERFVNDNTVSSLTISLDNKQFLTGFVDFINDGEYKWDENTVQLLDSY